MGRVPGGLNLKRVPSRANVALPVPQDPNALCGRQEVAGAEQIYLDLRGLHERGEEAAEALLREVIEPRWR